MVVGGGLGAFAPRIRCAPLRYRGARTETVHWTVSPSQGSSPLPDLRVQTKQEPEGSCKIHGGRRGTWRIRSANPLCSAPLPRCSHRNRPLDGFAFAGFKSFTGPEGTNKTGARRLLQDSWWSEGDLNPRHADFQSAALPTELPDRMHLLETRLDILLL